MSGSILFISGKSWEEHFEKYYTIYSLYLLYLLVTECFGGSRGLMDSESDL